MASESTPLIKNAQVDIEKLEEILGKFWNTEVKVSNVHLERGTARGNNFISDAWRLRFDHTKGAEAPQNAEREVVAPKYTSTRKDSIKKSIFVKSRPDDEEHNKLMNTDIHFKNEVLAYEKILVSLDEYASGHLRVPIYIYGNPNTVVLEDMENKSFESRNRKYITSWEQVWSPFQEMAKMHAASLVMQKLNKSEFEEMINQITEIPLEKTTKLAEKQATTIDTTVHLLELGGEPKAKEYTKILKDLQETAWAKQRELIKAEAPVKVVTHGNFWINNLLYCKNMAVLLDWQHVVYSSPAIDLCFFLYVNFSSAFLTNQRQPLLEYYLTHLHQCIYDACTEKQMSVPDIEELLKPLTYEWIDKEMRRCSLYGYMMAQWINPIFYWSEAVYDLMLKVGGMENMSVDQRMETMTSEQKDRVIQLTEVFMNEYKEIGK